MSDLFDNRVTRGEYQCPWCETNNDAAIYTGEEARSPHPGDVGICATCAMPMVYQEFGKPRVPTEGEWGTLNDDDNITKVRRDVFMQNARMDRVTHIQRGTIVAGDDDDE